MGTSLTAFLPFFMAATQQGVWTSQGVQQITEKGVVVNGVEYELDCLIYATGFEVQKTGTWNTIRGEGGLLNVFELQTIIFGLLIILFLILEPRGLYGLWLRLRNYFKAWPFSY